MDSVADCIRTIIKQRGLKNKAVAERAGYTEKKFSRILTGLAPMKSEDILRISRALNVTPNDLFGIQTTVDSKIYS